MGVYLKLIAMVLILVFLSANGVPAVATTTDDLTSENSPDNLDIVYDNWVPLPPENSQPDNSAHDNPGSGSYFEDFNDLADGNLAGQAGWEEAGLRGSGGLTVSSELPYKGAKGIVSPTHYSTTYRAYREISPVQEGRAMVYMRASSGALGTFWLCEGKSPENGREVGAGCARIIVGLDGRYNLLRFGALTVPITNDTWYKVTVEWDAPTTIAKAWVNDEYKGEFTTRQQILEGIDGVLLDVPDQTHGLKVYFDVISITTGAVALPTSAVDEIEPYWQNQVPFTITATASGTVENVELWHQYSDDNSSWDNWTLFGVDNDSLDNWSWEFTVPENDGYYEFYSIAVGSREEAPAEADARAAVDTTPPTSRVLPLLPRYRGDLPVTIDGLLSGTASDDLSGIASVDLWYRYRRDNGRSWSENHLHGAGEFLEDKGYWSWQPFQAEKYGYYEFWTIATDAAGNTEQKAEADRVVRVAKDLVRVGVIFAEPNDVDNQKEYWGLSPDEHFRRNERGLINYYDEVSYGAVAAVVEEINDSSGDWYKLDWGWRHYGTKEWWDINIEDRSIHFAGEAVKKAGVGYDDYDVVIVIFAGPSEQLPHIDSGFEPVGDRMIEQYWSTASEARHLILVSEYSYFDTWAHEVGHALGLPDLYLNAPASWGHVDSWGLMGAARELIHLSSWSKERLGWLEYSGHDLTQIVSYHQIGTLNALSTMEYGDSVPYFKAKEWTQADLQNIFLWMLDPPSKKATFYLLEARSGDWRYSEYDGDIPGDGLVVYQVNLTLTATETIIRVNVVESVTESILELLGVEGTTPTWLTTGEHYLLLGADGWIKISALDNDYYQTTFKISAEVEYPTLGSDPIMATLDPIPYQLNSALSSDIVQAPDLDLHAYTADGKHVGVNYSTGEYEIQIPDSIASGDMFEGTEWISVPENVEVYFVVSSKDTAEFTETSLGALENENGLYILEISYSDGDNYYLSPAVGQAILPGGELYHSFDITQNPDGTYSVEAEPGMDLLSLEAWQTAIDNIPDNLFINQATSRKQALKNKLSAVFNMTEANNYGGATNKLTNDILAKLDADGQADWVKQSTLVSEIRALVEILHGAY